MQMLSEEQLIENYNWLVEFIKKTFTNNRQAALLKLYDDMQQFVTVAPGSGYEFFHSAYAGGYIVHVKNVVKSTLGLMKLWEAMGYEFNWTKEEAMMVALNHDLGKVGSPEFEHYLPSDDAWKQKRGILFSSNPKEQYMKSQDRSLYMLQRYKVELTEHEFVAIKIHDGMYEEANKAYLSAFNDENQLKCDLPLLINHADIFSARLEYQQWKKSKKAISKSTTKFKPGKKELKVDNTIFDEMFKSSETIEETPI
jgi:hypothetical protein